MPFRCIGTFPILRLSVGWSSRPTPFASDHSHTGVSCGIKSIERGLVVKNDVGLANELPVNPWGLRGMESHPATLRPSAESTWGLIHAKGEAVEVQNVRIQKLVVGWSGVGVMLAFVLCLWKGGNCHSSQEASSIMMVIDILSSASDSLAAQGSSVFSG